MHWGKKFTRAPPVAPVTNMRHASVSFARGHIGGQSSLCPKRNFLKLWINVKIMEHAKRQLRWTIKTFCKRKNVKPFLFACRTILFSKGLRPFVKRQLYSSYCRNSIININLGSTEFKCYIQTCIQ